MTAALPHPAAPPVEAEIGWWHPRVAATGVLTPETRVVPSPPGGVPPPGRPAPDYWQFLATLLAAAEDVGGFPLVLRTGLAAAKHRWRSACLVAAPGEFDARVRATRDWCRGRGLPVRTWAVRQYVPLSAFFTAHDGLPIAREFRVFTRDAVPLCVHPVWPRRAVELGRPADPNWPTLYDAACDLRRQGEYRVLMNLAARAGHYLPGDWATDWAATEDGRWAAIDAAPAALAWHSPDCPHHPAAPGAAAAPPADPAGYAIDPAARADFAVLWQLEQCLEDPADAGATAGSCRGVPLAAPQAAPPPGEHP